MNKVQFLAALCAAFAITATTEADQIEGINDYLGAAVPAGVTPADHNKALRKAFKEAGFQAPQGADLVQHFATVLGSFVTNDIEIDGESITIAGKTIKVVKTSNPAVRTARTIRIQTMRILKDRKVANNGNEVLMEVIDLNTGEMLLANTNTNYLKSLEASVFKGLAFVDGVPTLPNGGLVCTAFFLNNIGGNTTYRVEDAAIVAAIENEMGVEYVQSRRTRTASGTSYVKSVSLVHETSGVIFDSLSAAIDVQGVKLIEERRSTKAQLAGAMVEETKSAEMRSVKNSLSALKEVADYLMSLDPELDVIEAMMKAKELSK